MLGAVADRIGGRVPALAGRVQGAADLAELQRRNQLPQVTPAAFVLPLGMRGATVRSATAPLYVQDVEEVVGVVLVLRGWEATGGAAITALDALIADVIRAVAGWAPVEAPGVFVLRAGRLVGMAAGTISYQTDFALARQLRHSPGGS